jgi:hypothetical protein
MADDNVKGLLLALGKAQVDAMFRRQDDHAVPVTKTTGDYRNARHPN